MATFLVLFGFLTGQLFAAGNNRVDQLTQQVASALTDSAKVNHLCELSQQYMFTDVNVAIQHALVAQDLASNIHYATGEAKALALIGNGHLILGEYSEAITLYFSALKIGEQLQDTALIMASHNSLGILCGKTKNEEQAFQHYNIALALAKKTNDKLIQSKVYNNLGDFYAVKEEYQRALTYFMKALVLKREIDDRKGLAIALQNIGSIYNSTGKPKQALSYLYEALQLDDALNNNMNKTVTLGCMAESYLKLHKPDSALAYAQQSYSIAQSTKSAKKLLTAAKLLADLHASQKNFAEAYNYQQIVAEQELVLNKEEQNHKAAEIIAKYENNKKELENIRLKAQQRVQALQIEKQQDVLVLSGFILLLLSFLVVGLYLSKRHFKAMSGQLQEATDLLLLRNDEITAQKNELCQQSIVLKKANAQLDRHNSFKNKIFSIVSHDLRAPFNSIEGILQLMQSRKLSDGEIKSIFETLSKNMALVVEMMNNLLSWSKAQMNGSTLEMQPLPLQAFVQQNLEMWQEQALEKNVELVNHIDSGLTVITDRERLAFVLRNLLANALKFSFKGGIVTVAAQQTEAGISLTVTDTGKGMSERDLAKLFSEKRFTTPGTNHERGTGLGLLLCKELIESLGGEIKVESREHHGSSFQVLLPCQIVEQEETARVLATAAEA